MKNPILLLLLFSSTAALLRAQAPCANRCLNFDGKDDYVQLVNSPIQGDVNFTVEGWFRSLDNDGITTCPSGNFERIIGCGGSRLEIGECSGKFGIFTTPSGFRSSNVTTGDGKWHYFAITRDGGAFRVYLDGNLVIVYDLPVGTPFSLDNTFRIGRWAGGAGLTESWQGDLDELRIWNSALSEEALLSNFNCKLSGQEPGITGYYNFDQGTPAGTNSNEKNLKDLSATKNDGALFNLSLSGNGSNWICSGTPNAVFCNDPLKNTPVVLGPTNNSVFKANAIPEFKWKWNGATPAPTDFYLEVFSHNDRVPKVVFSKKVTGSAVPSATVFGNAPVPGIYQWRVTDPQTGQSSAPMFFSVAPIASCGSVTALLKMECKDWGLDGKPIYNGTLTLTNTPTAGTPGCPVKYTSITPLVGSISGITPVLPRTIASGASQVFNFTFVPATASQTSITVQCLGNWQDPLLNTAHIQIDTLLKPCYCTDCKETDILVSGINVVPTTIPSGFNLSGSLTTTMAGPITAVEFQVQSISFSASPSACSNGVTSVETSGVFLHPATTINGSSALLYFNETQSLSFPPPLTNNNAAKDIKWMGNLPAASTIPFNLNIGLPSPLLGLNANCCKITYRVCIKATVFYGKDLCRSCSVIFCKDFTN